MITETEIKILNVDREKIRKTLIDNGAVFVKDVFQRNTLYENEHTKKEKIAVRLREEDDNCTFTVKGPTIIEHNHKKRKEYETNFPSFEFGNEVLTLQGFKVIGVGEAKREYYKLSDCSVEIIEMPNIPIFIEIEGTEENILRVANILGYTEKDYDARNVIEIYKPETNFLRF